MNEDLLIESSNREEVSNFKNTLYGYFKKWPYLLICVLLCISIAHLLLQFKQNQYNVSSKVIIKKNQQITDPSAILFGGGAGNSRFGRGVGDEAIIFNSFPLIKSTLEELKFDVEYKKQKGWNEIEIYNKTPVILSFSPGGIVPISTKFIVSKIDDAKFNLLAKSSSGDILIEGVYNFGNTIKLNDFKFKINKNPENWNSSIGEDETFIYLKSLIYESYAYKSRINFEEGQGGSNVLTLSMKTMTPEKSIDFINTLINKYIDKNLVEKNRVAENTVRFIDNQLAIIRDSLNIKEENLENFKSSEELSVLSIEGEFIISRFNEVESEKAQYEVLKKYYDYLKANIKHSDEEKLQSLILPSAFGIENDVINDLVKSLIELNNIKSQLLEDGNTKNPLIKQIDNRINQNTITLQESLDNLLISNNIRVEALEKQSNKITKQARKLPNTERQLVNLNRLLKLNENIYVFLMEKRSSAAITLSSNTPDCSIVEPAMLNPLSPIAPNRKIHYLIAIILGVFIPLVIFIVLDFLDDKVRDKDDVLSMTNIPIMGIIPNSKRIENNKIVFDKPKSALAESFRTIRTNLTFFQKNDSPFVIMVTSTVAKEGKTFCAINLAASLASSGKKTILLGFDLRKPRIHNYLDLENKAGVSNYLSGKASLDEIIVKTKQPNLSLISSGAIPPNPAELITTIKTKELFAELKKQYDFIIIDTPPIGLVADALLLQRESDLNLYVVRQGYSKREFLRQANDLYSTSKLHNLSLVVNGVDNSTSHNYGYYEEESKTSVFQKMIDKFKNNR